VKTIETQKASRGRKRIGECLIEAGLIDQETLAKALEIQKSQKKKVGQILIEMGVADDVTIAKAMAEQLKIPFFRLEKKMISKEVLKLVPAELAENYLLIPIEFDIKGISQVQINPAAGVTFAGSLRSILRQDPDVVMVGEIRDGETAEIALQAAQTGHLVFSTLHTNDAPAAVTRLLDLGVEPFLIADALLMVAGQRLVRGICPHCRIPDPMSFQFINQLPIDLRNAKETTFWKGAGCEKCQYTGYLGRIGVYEVLKISPAVKGIIAAGVSALKIKNVALKEGFRSMFLDGIYKAMNGLTTLEEVFRVAPPESETVEQEYVATPASIEEKPVDEPPSNETSFSIKSVKPKKILIADDNQIIIKLLVNILESESYHVVSADNGLDALKLVHKEKPDLIITDYMMPQMDGMELIKKIKSQLSTRVIPVIMLTAKDEVDSEAAR